MGPFPPAASWSAAYNARFAAQLAPYCELDCFTEPLDARSDPSRGSYGYRMFPASALGTRFTPAAYDAVLYTVGDVRDEAYRLARTYPGIVWLHDLALADYELVTRAQGVIVASERELGVLDDEMGGRTARPPTWVVPLAVSDSSARVPSSESNGRLPSFGDVARRLLEIARLDLETRRPSEATASVNSPAG